jgi:predicted acylesterase/phospholipase RssA
MRALVISSGGSKGAFAGGVAEHLIKEKNIDYDIFIGSSTGGLLLPHLAIGKIEKIKKIYTTVRQNDIFNVNPFKIRKTEDGYKTSINHINTILTFLKGSPTFGESKNLLKLIEKSFTEEEFRKLQDSGKQVIFTLSNLTEQRIEYFEYENASFETLCQWMWASANFVPFMSLFEYNGNHYADGGFGSYVPIGHAIEKGATNIDVIILEKEEPVQRDISNKNAFSLLMSTMRFMNTQLSVKDKMIAELRAHKAPKDVHIRIYYTPRNLIDNSLIFQPELMKQWWKEGLEYARVNQPVEFNAPANS